MNYLCQNFGKSLLLTILEKRNLDFLFGQLSIWLILLNITKINLVSTYDRSKQLAS